MARPSGRCLLVGLLGLLALDSRAGGQRNRTLVFPQDNGFRNCSCPADVRDCDFALANLLCRCRTVQPAAAEAARVHRDLTVWFSDTSALGLLLNFTLVQDLTLCLCGAHALPTQYLALCGLRSLRVRAEARAPEQSLLVQGVGDSDSRETPPGLQEGGQTCTEVSFLDVALFNRDSPLKAYSTANVASMASHFPHLSLSRAFPAPSNQSYVVTFIY